MTALLRLLGNRMAREGAVNGEPSVGPQLGEAATEVKTAEYAEYAERRAARFGIPRIPRIPRFMPSVRHLRRLRANWANAMHGGGRVF